jgi:hypothetical protein
MAGKTTPKGPWDRRRGHGVWRRGHGVRQPEISGDGELEIGVFSLISVN